MMGNILPRRAVPVAGCLAIAAVLAACGSDDDGYVAPPQIGDKANRAPAMVTTVNSPNLVPPSPSWQVATELPKPQPTLQSPGAGSSPATPTTRGDEGDPTSPTVAETTRRRR